MEEMDFERRRELRRQKREEMRLEAERMARLDDDEEEAARERRRRARQERLRGRESEEQPESLVLTNSHSVTETVSVSVGGGGGGGDEEEQALLERMAKREERRQRRMKEALDRQRQPDPAEDSLEKNSTEEERPSWRRGRHRDNEDEEDKMAGYSSRREEKEPEEPREEEEEEEAAPEGGEEEEQEEKVEVVEDKLRRSNLREQASAEEPVTQNQGLVEEETHSVVSERSNQDKSANSEAEGDAVASGEAEEVPEDGYVANSTENEPMLLGNCTEEDFEVSEILHSEDNEERGGAREDQRKHNGGLHEDAAPKQHRKPERTLSRGSMRSPEASAGDEQDEDARLEAERKLEELKRRRDDAESEEFERMRQKQQEAEAELEELKRKREERRKVLEEEERQKKREDAERKAREEEEKRKMKEEIERRRAEAAEKRQKVDDTVDGEDKPFKCVSPRGSSLKASPPSRPLTSNPPSNFVCLPAKLSISERREFSHSETIGERAEFLNKSAQKSAVKASHSPVVSKIDNRLEQYTSAAQRENKESRSPRSGAVDLPLVTDVRNIKSMWEKGNVFGSPGSAGSTFKEAAVIKTGVAGRINDWLNKTPEGSKGAGGRPADLKPVDVTNKRSLWENKGVTPTKVTGRGEAKSVANGMGH
ncbi:caldesmon 1a isoform 1-T3 [Menidia menidia]